VINGGTGELVVSWVSPVRDFDHVKVYRSTARGTLGELAANDIKASELKDANGLVDGTTYYYTVRAVDPAGNESANTNQISRTVVGSSPRTSASGRVGKASLSRNFSIGSRGDDVKLLQEILSKDGVYPEGLITGFFGNLTRRAVIRFQEKYAAEILRPIGLVRGTGFVGAATRAKANALNQ
jgi:peptidoglycan hydrolase-like protein with peptidoglycan-binding domain